MSTSLLIGIILTSFFASFVASAGVVYLLEVCLDHLKPMVPRMVADLPFAKITIAVIIASGFFGVILVAFALVCDYLIPAIS